MQLFKLNISKYQQSIIIGPNKRPQLIPATLKLVTFDVDENGNPIIETYTQFFKPVFDWLNENDIKFDILINCSDTKILQGTNLLMGSVVDLPEPRIEINYIVIGIKHDVDAIKFRFHHPDAEPM